MRSLKSKLILVSFCALEVALLIAAIASLSLAISGIPGLRKKSSAKSEQTFVGKIKSIDTKKRVLVLTTTEGDQEESFDFKKGVRVTSAHKAGNLKVSDLTVGMLVTVYIKSNKSSSEIFEILIM